jgi:hypothetical protein
MSGSSTARTVGVGEAGVDLDQCVEAAESAPRRRDDASEGLGWVAPCGFGRFDRCGDVGDRALGDGFDQGLAGGEVHVDGGSHDACAASDLGHAGLGIARQRVQGRVEDAVNAALRVGASAGLGLSG